MLLCKLIYISQVKEDFSEDLLNQILLEARTKNPSYQISGLLFCHENVFVQVLEGPREQVSQLYNAITQDPRHQKVTLVYFDEIQHRAFAEWKMGLPENSDVLLKIIKKYVPSGTFSLETLADTPGVRIWRMMLEISHRMQILGKTDTNFCTQ